MKDFEATLDPVGGRLITHDVRPPRHASYSSLDTYGHCRPSGRSAAFGGRRPNGTIR